MHAPSLIAIAISAVFALSACSEEQMPIPTAESLTPKVSDTPAEEAESGSLTPTVSDAPAAEADPGLPPPAAISVAIAGICNIESIGGVSGPELRNPVQVESDTIVSGWRAYQSADGTEAHAWLRVLGKDGGVAFQAPLAATVDRPDVVETVNRASALRSGFRQVKVTGLPQGSYTLEVILNAGSEWVRCRHTRQVQVM